MTCLAWLFPLTVSLLTLSGRCEKLRRESGESTSVWVGSSTVLSSFCAVFLCPGSFTIRLFTNGCPPAYCFWGSAHQEWKTKTRPPNGKGTWEKTAELAKEYPMMWNYSVYAPEARQPFPGGPEMLHWVRYCLKIMECQFSERLQQRRQTEFYTILAATL